MTSVCEMADRSLRNRRMKEREMIKEWESWSWLIREDVERLENRLQACYVGMMTAGVPADMREDFVLNKLQEIIISVTGTKA